MSPVAPDNVCAVVYAVDLTMQFYGRVSTAPVMLKHEFHVHLHSANYARCMKKDVEQSAGPPLQVAVANGVVCTSLGTCKIRHDCNYLLLI